MLVQNTRRKKGQNPKLQLKFVGLYEMVAAFGNHTYQLERLGQSTVQNECRLTLYRAYRAEKRGKTPETLDSKSCKKPSKDCQNKNSTAYTPREIC